MANEPTGCSADEPAATVKIGNGADGEALVAVKIKGDEPADAPSSPTPAPTPTPAPPTPAPPTPTPAAPADTDSQKTYFNVRARPSHHTRHLPFTARTTAAQVKIQTDANVDAPNLVRPRPSLPHGACTRLPPTAASPQVSVTLVPVD